MISEIRTGTAETNPLITSEDLKKVYWRNIFGLQWGWNYESMQGLGYCYVIMPILRRLYSNDPEKMKKALQVELGYFNTAQAMSNFIIGADAALQEQFGIDKAEDTIIGVKAGLMGPFAGVGDTIFITIYRAIVFSIAAYMALEGQAAGLFIALFCGMAVLALRYRFTLMGYTQGQKLASGFGGQLNMVTEGASILGLTVVGALIPSVVNAKLPIAITVGAMKMTIQSMMDRIMPGLFPLAIVLFSYWLLGKKGMNSTRLILLLMVLGIFLGILSTIFPAG